MMTHELAALIGTAWEHGPEAVRKTAATTEGRDSSERLRYATDPHGYARDILGVTLTPQQEDLLELFRTERRVIAPSATSVGKSFVGACAILWLFDAVAAVPGPDGTEQGCIVLLLGPDHQTILATSYDRLLAIYRSCARRGVRLPGEPSTVSVSWKISEGWFFQAVSPPRKIGEQVAHSGSGRHGPNMVAFGEEAVGIPEATLRAIEGGFTSAGNRIWLPYNPTGIYPQFLRRQEAGDYKVMRLSALDHPNITERREIVPGAVGFEAIDKRVETECQDMGTYLERSPDTDRREFAYALPPPEAGDPAPRVDGMPGHRDGELRVYRPQGEFSAQVLGLPPAEGSAGLFDPAMWDKAVARWKAGRDPETPPDRVGVDCGGGGDLTVAVPAWGFSGREILELWRTVEHSASGAQAVERQAERAFELEEAIGAAEDPAALDYWREVSRRQTAGIALKEEKRIRAPVTAAEKRDKAIEGMRKTRRLRLGMPRPAPAGDGAFVAGWLRQTWPSSPFVADRDGGDARYIVGHLGGSLNADVTGVSFGSAPLPYLESERATDNRRSQMYEMLAWLVRLELVDIPPCPELREECLALQWVERETWATVGGRRVQTSGLTPKIDIRKSLGRSPDRADAAVLAVAPVDPGVRF